MIRRQLAFAAFLLVTSRNDRTVSFPPTIREVEIVGLDYAFTAPRQLSAGPTIFRFTNKGKVIHELDLALLKSGTTAAAVMSALNAKRPLPLLIETPVGILIALAGRRSSAGLSTQLLAGRDYLVICRFQDSASAPMHSRMGMISVIHVPAGNDIAPQSVRADTIIGMEYAFRAPRTLAAGRHTFTFVNTGKQRHEVNITLLRRGVTLDRAFKIAKADEDLFSSVDEWEGVLIAAPGTASPGRLELTLLPGREYMIKCDLTDAEKAPAHVTLGMFGSIRTTK
jgi:hypothetical protein